jgi:trans-aconitate 2-methyltransferase
MNESLQPGPDAAPWVAVDYARFSSLQEAMASEVLERLQLRGDEAVLDGGCGDGRLSARIVERLAHGSVLGVDASADMIGFARDKFAAAQPQGRLSFEVADARRLSYDRRFDLVVSFNALHWVPEQAAALRGIAAALRPGGRALLRLVVKGEQTSLEEVAESVRGEARWAAHFVGFTDPYLRLSAPVYAERAAEQGLRCTRQHSALHAWDFVSDAAFFGFCKAGFGAWTRRLPATEHDRFVRDVIERYRQVLALPPAQANVFRFYQMDIALVL